MEVSTREVAGALNLPIKVIEALEADDYDELPPTVFTRGYLRSYARLLELPGDELLALYPVVQADSEPGIPVVRETPGLDAPQLKLAIVAAAVLIAVVVLLIWIFSGDETTDGDSERDESPAVETPTAETPAAESRAADRRGDEDDAGSMEVVPEVETAPESFSAEPQVVAAEPAPATERSRDVRPEAQVAPPEPQEVRQETDIEPPSVPATSQSSTDLVPTRAASPGEPGVRRITEFGDDLITFTFDDDCWVEVKSLDGANLYSDLNRAGRTLKLTGKGPFRILLGYAPGVRLEFNGESVPLARSTRNNVANLVLGE
jgi:cytoskeleton protein RodZ